MKRILFLFAMVALNIVVSEAKPKVQLTPRQALIQRLANIQKKGYMYGHQDDPFYGVTWMWDADRSDTKDLVGDYPGVMGFDLGGIEKDDAKNLDSVPFTRIREEIIRQYQRGGIVTVSWHPRNPLLGTTAWIENDLKEYAKAYEAMKSLGQEALIEPLDPRGTVRSVLPEGIQYDKFQLWLKRVSTFLLSLKDENGQLIPLIFRPWHENNGSWFWWGQNLCSDAEFHAFWNMTQDYINAQQTEDGQTLGNTLVWSYSPNLQGTWTETDWLVRYPGDDRVDLIGEDAYQWGTEADFSRGLDADLALITKIAAEHGKLIALTECGYKNSPDATWWQRVFKPIIEKYPVCYFLPWRNYSKEHFGASKDAPTADDFKAWAKDKRFLFVNDINKIKR